MQAIIVFGIEILTSLLVSTVVVRLLRTPTRDVLTDICGTQKRAAFWMTFTIEMLYLAPLLLVILSSQADVASLQQFIADFRETLFRALLGTFIGLLIIGHTIWRTIPAFNTLPSAATPSSQKDEAGV